MSILREAMLELHDFLGNLELDIAEAGDLPREQRGAVASHCASLHDSCAKFYDEAIHQDRAKTYEDFLAAFPAIEQDYDTGGGCTCWHLKVGKGCIIITTVDDPSQPWSTDDEVAVCHFADDEDWDEDCANAALPWAEAIEWVRARLAPKQQS